VPSDNREYALFLIFVLTFFDNKDIFKPIDNDSFLIFNVYLEKDLANDVEAMDPIRVSFRDRPSVACPRVGTRRGVSFRDRPSVACPRDGATGGGVRLSSSHASFRETLCPRRL
jgi:hypothetical protein